MENLDAASRAAAEIHQSKTSKPVGFECAFPQCESCRAERDRIAAIIRRHMPDHFRDATQKAGGGVDAPMDRYYAGLLGNAGGGNADWWHTYIRSELERAYEFYDCQFEKLRAALSAAELRAANLEIDSDAMRDERDEARGSLSAANAERDAARAANLDLSHRAIAAEAKQAQAEAERDRLRENLQAKIGDEPLLIAAASDRARAEAYEEAARVVDERGKNTSAYYEDMCIELAASIRAAGRQ